METVLADVTVSMSEFKKNPAAVLWEANNRPVTVLNHNRAVFYIVEPRLFEAMLEELADQGLYRKAANRLAEKALATEVDIDVCGGCCTVPSASGQAQAVAAVEFACRSHISRVPGRGRSPDAKQLHRSVLG